MSYAFEPRAVQRNKRVYSGAELSSREQMSHAAKVPSAFFADRCYEIDSSLGRDMARIERSRQRDEAHNPAGVVADSRRVEPQSLAPDAHVGSFGENRVEMS